MAEASAYSPPVRTSSDVIPGGRIKTKRPRPRLGSWDARRTALPRSLLNTSLRWDLSRGNGSDGLWMAVAPNHASGTELSWTLLRNCGSNHVVAIFRLPAMRRN
jgi:hypothetical protein